MIPPANPRPHQRTPPKKLVLVFPPMVMPTSPPLGIALLKGYLTHALPDWEITLLDLNLFCFDRLFDGLQTGAIGLGPRFLQQIGGDTPAVLAAARFFKAGSPTNFYQHLAHYDQHARLFLQFTETFSHHLGQDATLWYQGGAPMPLLQACAARIVAERPTCVGISMIFSQQLAIGAALGRYLRHTIGLRVFNGGSCFTTGAASFLKWYPEATDGIVVGDGEEALQHILEQDGNPSGVAGTVLLRQGRLEQTPPHFRKEIDTFGTPDFSGLPLHDYYAPTPVVPLLLSRGCYWRRCTFCVHYLSAGESYRLHTLPVVIDLLRRLVAQGITHFALVDEMIPPGHFARLAAAIDAAGLNIAYYALAKPQKAFTPQVLQKMAASGCRYILWGVESGCQRVLDRMDKGTRTEEIAQVLHDAHAVGIANHVYIICGFPTETQAEFAETVAFLKQHQTAIAAIHRGLFALEEGSPIAHAPQQFGITATWTIRETALGKRIGYRTQTGMSMEEAIAAFQSALPFFRSFNPHAQFLANFRDHALLVYRHHADNRRSGVES
ncbi:MAG: radical SAM protein [Magnetococcales bacterium]|nr:radical SAM protein [Magnetococcales bacterium]